MRALIVDDSRFVRDFLRGLLEEKGIECEEAADGSRVSISSMNSCPLISPSSTGTCPSWMAWICSKICAPKVTDDLKVMMVTTEAEDDFITRSLDAGADEYLMKPFDNEALTEKLAMLGFVEV
jgi:two-component system chemotaxis response regulator CheY